MIGLLVSYWQWRNVGLARFADWDGPFFIDSGAFSAFASGAQIDVDAYAAWVRAQRHADIVCTLDVIGDPEATARNTERLREHHALDVMPVFHVGSPWDELRALAKQHSLVAAGGMVEYKARRQALLSWAVKCCQIARQSDCHLHGFGLTSRWTLAQVPFFSIDSTSWRKFDRFGELLLWDNMRGLVRFGHANRATWHTEAPLLRSYGLDPERLARPAYGRPTSDAHEDELREVMRVQVRSWIRCERWRRQRFGTMRADGMPDGPHLFLVMRPTSDHLSFINEALAMEDAA